MGRWSVKVQSWSREQRVGNRYYVEGSYMSTLGLTYWNLRRFEFKFDDTRLSSWYKNKISMIKKKIVKFWQCYVSALLAVSTKLRQPTGQRQSNVRMQQKKINQANLILYYEESLVSSDLNLDLLKFNCAHPNVYVALPKQPINLFIPVQQSRRQLRAYCKSCK